MSTPTAALAAAATPRRTGCRGVGAPATTAGSRELLRQSKILQVEFGKIRRVAGDLRQGPPSRCVSGRDVSPRGKVARVWPGRPLRKHVGPRDPPQPNRFSIIPSFSPPPRGSPAWPVLPAQGASRCRGHDVRCERETGSLQLEALVVDPRLQRLQLATRLAEQVEGVRDVHRGVVQGERVDLKVRLPERSPRRLLPGRVRAHVDAWKEVPRTGAPNFLRTPQGGLGGVQRRTVREPFADPSIQRLGAEQLPPPGGNFRARDETLHGAADSGSGGRSRRQRLRRVRSGRGGGGPPVIGTDRTAGERNRRERRGNERRVRACTASSIKRLQTYSPMRME